jgi:cell division protein FtsI/penicillin-binding protein 2
MTQAHIALASGGLLGQLRTNPLHGLLAEYLPDRETDLAFISLVEQWGLLAGLVALLAAAVLVWRLALAARVARTRHASLVAGGMAVLIGVEAVVSLGGNLGLLPLAGVPFPLLSYGGTAAVVHLAALGIVLGTRREGARRRLWAAPRLHNPPPRLVRLTSLGALALLLAFGQYGWRLQAAAHGAQLREIGQAEIQRCVALPAPRGAITDRHGTPLANSATGQDRILAVPALLRRDPHAVSRLAALAGTPEAGLRQQLDAAPGTQLTLAVAKVPAATGARITAAHLTGTIVVPDQHRGYPYGSLLGPLLGFTGVATPADVQRWPGLPPGEIVGRAGVEEEYDPVLRGVDGTQCLYVDPAGVPVAMGPATAPVPGADLRLSLDLGLQRQLTGRLAAAIGASGGDMGGAVALDPKTGQVLAMASLPSYDDNVYGPPVNAAALRNAAAGRGDPMLEHVTQSSAPPGSTFKLVVASADMVHRVLPPDEVIPTGGSWTLGDHTFGNWRTFGPQNLIQAITWSNDVYFYQLAWKLGPDPIISTAQAYGVGSRTGIDLPGESSGYLGTPRTVGRTGATWYPGSTVILGIGQGYLDVTPLQDARWTAAVATGRLVTPRLGLASGTGGSYSPLPAPAPQVLPFAGALGPVRAGMQGSASSGTGAILTNLLPIQAGSKTGSAEDPASPNHQPDSWFTAAAPLNAPALAVTSFVRGGGQGATTSGPVVDQTLQYFFAHQAQILAGAPGHR